ncbi:MAG: diphosphomevalonate decarboxylase [Bacteriovoracaceae bacterium]|jgi:diphosphomevalonate decarboxylase|nr:diphosphomevalonate decarboxylase [Bacteriovoracaceae bacterium]
MITSSKISKSKLGSISVTSPSNIAFVKYWGKFGRQYPINPSISMTLSNCVTQMDLEFYHSDKFSINTFLFENEPNDFFKKKFQDFLESILDEIPKLKNITLNIKCENTFPHSSGIASSASSFSALCFGILSFINKALDTDYSTNEISHFSRIGSGSASRSPLADFAIWGKSNIDNTSNDYAIAFSDFHSSFKNLQDTVVIIEKGQKSVSSSKGHMLMNSHIYKDIRVEQANNNLGFIVNALKTGDIKEFGRILEEEALTLHGLMMTSNPSFILMKPKTLEVIEKIRSYRQAHDIDMYFTLDAGANLHLIYPESEKQKVLEFLDKEVSGLECIYDHMGAGPKVLEFSLE